VVRAVRDLDRITLVARHAGIQHASVATSVMAAPTPPAGNRLAPLPMAIAAFKIARISMSGTSVNFL
jgi:hypothetical protein